MVLFGAALVVAGFLLLVCSLVAGRDRPGRRPRRGRHEGVMMAGVGVRPVDLRQAMLDRSVGERVVRPGVAALAGHARRFTPAGMVRSLERRVALAGLTYRWPIERLLATKLVLGGVALVLGLLRVLSGPSRTALLLALVFTAVAYFLPDLLLYNAAVKRQEQIAKELADTIDQITITIEAGLGFEAAIDRSVRSGDGLLKTELARLLRDIQLGVPRTEALQKLLERTDVRDLRNFVHAMSQAEMYGIPIAQVLRVQSGELREKRRQRAEEAAMKVPVKILMPLMACILPALFIVLMGPAVIRVSQSGFGGG